MCLLISIYMITEGGTLQISRILSIYSTLLSTNQFYELQMFWNLSSSSYVSLTHHYDGLHIASCMPFPGIIAWSIHLIGYIIAPMIFWFTVLSP